MNPTIYIILTVLPACLVSAAIGAYLATNYYKRHILKLNYDMSQLSLKLLESKQHLRKLTAHVHSSLRQKSVIQNLQINQASTDKELRELNLQLKQQEKRNFLETARLKLELAAAKSENQHASRQKPDEPSVTRLTVKSSTTPVSNTLGSD